MNIVLPRETAFALRFTHAQKKIKNFLVKGYLNRDTPYRQLSITYMPNQHAADKESLSFYIPRPLAVRLRKKAQQRKESLTQYLIALFTNATQDVELTAEDYRQIAAAIDRARKTGKRVATKLANTR